MSPALRLLDSADGRPLALQHHSRLQLNFRISRRRFSLALSSTMARIRRRSGRYDYSHGPFF